jgi:hypothetical protein
MNGLSHALVTLPLVLLVRGENGIPAGIRHQMTHHRRLNVNGFHRSMNRAADIQRADFSINGKVKQTVIAENAAMIPKLLDELGSIVWHLFLEFVPNELWLLPSALIVANSGKRFSSHASRS